MAAMDDRSGAAGPSTAAARGSTGSHPVAATAHDEAGSSNSGPGAGAGDVQSREEADSSQTKSSQGKKEPKKRKVGQACVYCRRSHMTCDSERPCKRCIKRDIGHLCHDEAPGKGHGHAHHAMPKNKAPSQSNQSPSQPPQLNQPRHQPSDPPQHRSLASPPDSTPAPAPALALSSAPGQPRLDALQAYISSLTQQPQASTSGSNGSVSTSNGASNAFFPQTQQSPTPALRNNTFLGTGVMSPPSSGSLTNMFPSANRPSLGGMSSDALGSLVTGAPSMAMAQASASNVGTNSTPAPTSANFTLPSEPTLASPPAWTNPTAAGLGGAGFLGLGGSDGLPFGGIGGGGDAAGGNEFNLLSEFFESLDGPGANANSEGVDIDMKPPANSDASVSGLPSSSNLWSPRSAGYGPTVDPSSNAASSPLKRRRPSSPHPTQSPAKPTPSRPSNEQDATPVSVKGFSTKTERFFLTAADQVDGPRDERLGKVIQAKYDAGLLRPYNHVKGYARLSSWMDRNVSQQSKRRILKPLSIFRPRFRAVAQSLSDVDLIYIEEAFERLLLDYDRVFSTQGIPACLWRRTGEIYKGNREFAELVGVGIEELREGRLCIYELMEEESACNYWEKYGAVSFDPGQKAVLTSCVLIARQGGAPLGAFSRGSGTATGATNGTTSVVEAGSGASTAKPGGSAAVTRSNSVVEGGAGNDEGPTSTTMTASAASTSRIHCCFSFTIRRDVYGCPILVAGNFLPTS